MTDTEDLPAGVVARTDYSTEDPGPRRTPLTRLIHQRLREIQAQTVAGAPGWYAVVSRAVTQAKKQPLKAQRDRLRKSHDPHGWRFRVLTEYDEDDHQFHTLWAHYDPPRGGPKPKGSEEVGAPLTLSRRLPPPPAPGPPHPEALRPRTVSGLVGMDWANEPEPDDSTATRPLGEG